MDEIVNLLWQRDEQALNIMEKQYGAFCHRIIARFLRNLQDAEEALNDVWLKVWNSIPPAKPKYLRAYLAKTARNTALHYIEREQAQKRSGITVLLDELAECIPDFVSMQEMDAVILKDTLNRFVRSLHGDERSFFLHRYYFGESIKEIATDHKCSENRVTVTLHRTRNKLRALLEKEGYQI